MAGGHALLGRVKNHLANRPFARTLSWILLLMGAALIGRDAYFVGKDGLGEMLIASAFERSMEDGEPHLPWSWADTYPVGELIVPRLEVRRHILAGAGASTLGWGLGHVSGTRPLGAPGVAVVAGHRDQEFRFLEDVLPGDTFRLRTPSGDLRYRVVAQSIHHHDDLRVLEDRGPSRLRLVTCYPIRGLRPTSLRWVVSLEPVESAQPSSSETEPLTLTAQPASVAPDAETGAHQVSHGPPR